MTILIAKDDLLLELLQILFHARVDVALIVFHDEVLSPVDGANDVALFGAPLFILQLCQRGVVRIELCCVIAHVHEIGRVASLVVEHTVVGVGLQVLGVARLRLGRGLRCVASCYPLAIPGFHLNIIKLLNERSDCGKTNQPLRDPRLLDKDPSRCTRAREGAWETS